MKFEIEYLDKDREVLCTEGFEIFDKAVRESEESVSDDKLRNGDDIHHLITAMLNYAMNSSKKKVSSKSVETVRIIELGRGEPSEVISVSPRKITAHFGRG